LSKDLNLTGPIPQKNWLVLHFFLKDILRSGIKGEIADLKQGNEVVFSRQQREVNNWENEVKKVGGIIISNAEEFGKGYYGLVFTDPDGRKFNVFYM
jgi:uncharacterized protein